MVMCSDGRMEETLCEFGCIHTKSGAVVTMAILPFIAKITHSGLQQKVETEPIFGETNQSCNQRLDWKTPIIHEKEEHLYYVAL